MAESSERFQTPILFLIFNRPDLTQIVFDRIREVKPKYLFVAADGPREDHPEDPKKCDEARNKVLNRIDWDCELKTLFRDKNLGCGLAVSQAITWFFEHVEEGIILEDDLVPHQTFFKYCQFLLYQYKDNSKVMHISGNNFQLECPRVDSIYFSRYTHCWGWATWKNRWNYFELNPQDNRGDVHKVIANVIDSGVERNYWEEIFHETFVLGHVDSWAYSWQYANWKNQGLSILPYKNLVMNNGFGIEATHTKVVNPSYKKLKVLGIGADIYLPKEESINKVYDNNTFQIYFQPDRPINFFTRIKEILGV